MYIYIIFRENKAQTYKIAQNVDKIFGVKQVLPTYQVQVVESFTEICHIPNLIYRKNLREKGNAEVLK